MMLPQEIPMKEKRDEEEGKKDDEEEEEEEVEPPLYLHIIQDDTEMDDIDDDVMEEACVRNGYNIQSKGAPKCDDSSSTSKTATKRTPTAMISTKIYLEKTKDSGMDSTSIKSTISMDLTQNIIGDLKLDYDLVEDLK